MRLTQNHLISRIENALRSRVGMSPAWVKARLLDRDFRVRKGTIHCKEDYDDAWLLALALHSRSVIDVGANVGQAAFILLCSDSVQELVLVEPNPAALALASESLIHNHLIHRTHLVCAFAADKGDNEVRFWTLGAGSAGSMYAEHAISAAKKNRSFVVPTTTVDMLCDLCRVTPDLVKIDTEGAENLVLQGSTKLATQRRTRFLVEMHSNQALPMAVNAEKVIEWCQQKGFSPWYLAEHKLLREVHQVAHRGRCHLLLQPDDWEYPQFLEGIGQSDPISTGSTRGT